MTQYSILIAGSTHHTRLCAESLARDPRFKIVGVLTPTPRPVGRKQELLPNRLHQFAVAQQIPVVQIDRRIDSDVKQQVLSQLTTAAQTLDAKPDFLLVVDFGYIVPNWLLELPEIAPINIHPSVLPRWRGSSPGQFVLLYGEKTSAVSVIVMNEQLDQGDLVTQLPFAVAPHWTQTEYYSAAFALVAEQLPEILEQLAQGKVTPQAQPLETPTPIAQRLSKEDGFVPWAVVQAAMRGRDQAENANLPLSPILTAAFIHHRSLAQLIFHASQALSPWPGLWTIIPTAKGAKRMKILKTSLLTTQDTSFGNTAESTRNPELTKLKLEKVQLEGKQAAMWNEVKNTIQKN